MTRTVTVADTTAPVITLTGLASVTHELGTTYTDAGATSDGGETVTTSGTVDVNTAGIYTITYSASDAAGNAATSVTRTVTVVDTTAPVITLTGLASVRHELGVNYSDSGATSDGGETVTTSGTVDVNTAGTYTLTYSASGVAGNAATSVTRTVTVSDTVAPVITLTGSTSVTHELGTTYTDAGVTSDGGETVTTSGTVDVNTAGTYTLTYSASDAEGNVATSVTRTVTVVSSSGGGSLTLTSADMLYKAQVASITLDGNASDWADAEFKSKIPFETGGELVLFEEYGGGTWSGPSDHSSAVAFAWDASSLYIGVVVTDDTHQNGGSGWNGDSIQMVFANAAQDTVTHLYNYGLSDGGDVVIMNEKGAGGTEASITRDEDTTTTLYEFSFPAASLGLDGYESGMQIGVGVLVNDGDTQDGQGGQKGWSGWGPYAAVYGKTASATGLVTLVGEAPGGDLTLSEEDMKYEAKSAVIELDGGKDDWVNAEWKGQIPFEKGGELVLFEEYGGGTWSGPSDHSSAVAFAWDASSLYIGVVVTDDTHQNGGSGWNGDSIQMVFANAAQDTVTHLYNYGLSDGGDVVIMNEKGPGGTEASITRDEDTTTTLYEFCFPAASLGLDGYESGMQIGVGLCVNDGDTQDGQGGQKGWSGWGPYAAVYGKTASATGLVSLVGETSGVRAISQGVSIYEGKSVSITLKGADQEEQSLVYAVVTQPSNGTLSGNAPDLTYTPSANFTGDDSFTFKVNNGTVDSRPANVDIEVLASTVANPKSISTSVDTPLDITLTGADVDERTLTYEVVTQPSNGTLSGSAPNLVYTPAIDFSGTDNFKFKVNNGQSDSAAAMVTITVSWSGGDLTLSEEDMKYEAKSAVIELDGGKDDWVNAEWKGQIPFEKGGELVLFEEYGGGTWSGPSDHSSAVAFAWDASSLYIGVVVTDDTHQNGGSGWNGDSIQMVFANAAQDTVTHLYNYGLSDGGDVVIMNEKGPGGTEASITRDEDTTTTLYEFCFPAASLGLDGYESGMQIGVGLCVNDGDTQDGQGGQKGWSGWGPYAAVYGKTASATGLVSLVGETSGVRAISQGVSIYEGKSVSITLKGADQEEQSLVYAVVTQPSNGTLSGNAPDLTYTPSANFTGDDSFTFKVNNGTVDSRPANVDIEVLASTVANPKSISTSVDTPLDITLTGADVDERTLTYEVVTQPSNGTLSGSAPNLVYTPAIDFSGTDNFKFKVNNGQSDSAAAMVTITVSWSGGDLTLSEEDMKYEAKSAVIELDGGKDDWVNAEWKGQIPFEKGGELVLFEEYGGGTWSGPSDHSSAVAFAWDASSLYIGVVVTDDTHQNGGSGWNGDSIQMVFANAAQDTVTHLYNYGLSDGGDVVIMNEKGPGGTEASITRDEDTTTTLYEFCFPAASLGLDGYESGMQIGVGLCVNDGDTQDGQGGQKGWSGWGPYAAVYGKTASATGLVSLVDGTTGSGGSTDSGETTTDQENFGEPVTYTNVATTLIGQVTINGTAAREGDVVAFYVGDELRGKQAVVVDAGTAWLNAQVHASGEVETATIKVYEASTGITHDKVGLSVEIKPEGAGGGLRRAVIDQDGQRGAGVDVVGRRHR